MEKKPKHTINVRIKVFASSKEEAEKIVTELMNTGVNATYAIATEFGEQIHHWQIKE